MLPEETAGFCLRENGVMLSFWGISSELIG